MKQKIKWGKNIKQSIKGASSAIALLTIWTVIEPRIINTEYETATIPNLPAKWEGEKIGQISDFQIGLWGSNPGTAKRSIQVLIKNKPAAVLISGDFIYHSAPNPDPEINTAIKIIQPLIQAGIPTYAVLGNHDYGMSKKTDSPTIELSNNLKAELEAIGVQVLKNESTIIQASTTQLSAIQSSKDKEDLYLVAIGSQWANQADVQAALSELDDESPRIALMHNPDSFEAFPANTAPLAVAGHTHGGQIRIPGLPQWSWLRLTQKDEVYADGWAKGYGQTGNRLYINPGIGMSIIPVRLFCPPEVTFFTLQGT